MPPGVYTPLCRWDAGNCWGLHYAPLPSSQSAALSANTPGGAGGHHADAARAPTLTVLASPHRAHCGDKDVKPVVALLTQNATSAAQAAYQEVIGITKPLSQLSAPRQARLSSPGHPQVVAPTTGERRSATAGAGAAAGHTGSVGASARGEASSSHAPAQRFGMWAAAAFDAERDHLDLTSPGRGTVHPVLTLRTPGMVALVGRDDGAVIGRHVGVRLLSPTQAGVLGPNPHGAMPPCLPDSRPCASFFRMICPFL